jgi:hypothetical protein
VGVGDAEGTVVDTGSSDADGSAIGSGGEDADVGLGAGTVVGASAATAGPPPARAPDTPPIEIEDPNAALSLRESGRIRPLGDLYSVSEKQLDGEVIDAKLVGTAREGWTYDLRVVTRDGLVRQARYDAATLALRSLDGEPVR